VIDTGIVESGVQGGGWKSVHFPQGVDKEGYTDLIHWEWRETTRTEIPGLKNIFHRGNFSNKNREEIK
jgi:hypothetical protein